MSGGVDSSVAAALLARQGHDVIGLSMQLYDQSEGTSSFGSCCTIDDLHDARRVAARLGIPHYIVNFERQFDEHVVSNFVREYSAGRTPIPCVHCNGDLKFATLAARAAAFGASSVATGHYARVEREAGGTYRLKRGLDPAKDQSVLPLHAGSVAAVARPVSGWRSRQGRGTRSRARSRAAGRREAGQSRDLFRRRRRSRRVPRAPRHNARRGKSARRHRPGSRPPRRRSSIHRRPAQGPRACPRPCRCMSSGSTPRRTASPSVRATRCSART